MKKGSGLVVSLVSFTHLKKLAIEITMKRFIKCCVNRSEEKCAYACTLLLCLKVEQKRLVTHKYHTVCNHTQRGQAM